MSDSPVKVEIGAKASLEVKAEIPKESAGRFVDALTDLVRPWSEARGLRADIIRLHREDVALQIAQKAAHRIALDARRVHAIPLKTIVPLLERGSQEDPADTRMIGMWANLLASSATTDAVSPRFVSLLSEMNRRQALLLIEIFNFEEARTIDLLDHCTQMVDAPLALNAIELPSPHIVSSIVEVAGPALLSLDAVSPENPTLADTKFKRVAVWEPDRQRATDLGILESLGLIRFGAKSSGYFPGSYVSIEFNQGACTALGDELLYLVGEADPDEISPRTPSPGG